MHKPKRIKNKFKAFEVVFENFVKPCLNYGIYDLEQNLDFILFGVLIACFAIKF